MYNFNPERLEIVMGSIAMSRMCYVESLKWLFKEILLVKNCIIIKQLE